MSEFTKSSKRIPRRYVPALLLAAGASLLMPSCTSSSDEGNAPDIELPREAPTPSETTTTLTPEQASAETAKQCARLAVQATDAVARYNEVQLLALGAPGTEGFEDFALAIGSYELADTAEACKLPEVAAAYRADGASFGFSETEVDQALECMSLPTPEMQDACFMNS
jgi:hypothetical protein